MRDCVMRHVDGIARQTAIPRLGIGIAREPSLPITGFFDPIVCIVLQGTKQVMIGDRVLRYDPASYFMASLELPATGRVVEATPERPYVAAGLTLDRTALADIIADVPATGDQGPAGFAVAPVTPDLLDAWAQLFALLDRPQDIAVLAPLRERELLYRLLQGSYGGMLRQIVRDDSRLSQVRRAILWIQAHFDQAIRVEQLAEMAAMSIPSFHRHFKAATAMSPLQFQKSIRL